MGHISGITRGFGRKVLVAIYFKLLISNKTCFINLLIIINILKFPKIPINNKPHKTEVKVYKN